MYDNNRSNNYRPAFRPDANPGEYAHQDQQRAPRQRTRIVRNGSSVYDRQVTSYSQPRREGQGGQPTNRRPQQQRSNRPVQRHSSVPFIPLCVP